MSKLLLLLIIIFIVACNNDQKNRSSLGSSDSGCSGEAVASSKNGPLFKISGEVITRDKLPSDLKNLVYRNEFEAYSKNQNIFKEYALRVYLARKAGKLKDINNPPKLMELLEIPEPSDKEMRELYNQSKARLPKEVTFETMKPQISGYLKNQKIGEIFQSEVKKMEQEGVYQSLVAGPAAPEIKLTTDKYPSMGNKSAKIHLIEVADYTCGHCQHAHPEVKKIVDKYKDKIKFTQINYSLRPNDMSGLLVKGGICAQKQGVDKFWSYHDAAFAHTSKPHDHSAKGHSHGPKPEELKEIAKASGLDMKKFEACISDKATQEELMQSNSALSAQGISGTPAFIINNKKVEGGVDALEAEIKKLL